MSEHKPPTHSETHRSTPSSWIPHLEALNTIIAEVASSHDFPYLLRLSLDRLLDALNVEMGAVWVMGYHVNEHLPEEVVSAIRVMTQTISPFTIDDWQEESIHKAKNASPVFERTGIRSTAILPILSEGRVIGRLVLLSKDPHPWSQEELLFAKLVGRQLGVAAERLQLTHPAGISESKRDRYIDRLLPLIEDLNRPFSIDEVIQAIGLSTQQLSGSDRVAVFILHPDHHISCAWSSSLSESFTHGMVKFIEHRLRDTLTNSPTPLLIVDSSRLTKSPRLRSFARQEGIGAFGLWPLYIHETASAILGCFFTKAHTWSDAEQDAMLALARQGAIALDNARVLQKQERRAKHLAALNEVSRSLASTLDLKPLLNNILKSAVDILDCEAGSLMLSDEVTGELVFMASVGSVAQNLIGQRIPPGAGVAGKAVDTSQPIIVNDVRDSQEWFPNTDLETGFVTRALMVAPMRVKDRVIGAIEVINKKNRAPFMEEEQEIIMALASQAAVALDNARLFEAERRRRGELEVLRKASLQLTSSLDIAFVLESILEHALKFVAGENAHIYLFDGEELHIGASRWRSGEKHTPSIELQQNGLIYTVARSGRKIVITDAANFSFYPDQPREGAILALPLRKGEQVHGVMNVYFPSPHNFDEDELRVLELLADQAAVALENATLYETLQDKLHEISILSEVSAALRDAETLKEMGPLLASHATRMVGAVIAVVYLMDPDIHHLVPVGAAGISVPLTELEWSLGDIAITQALQTGSLHQISGNDRSLTAIPEGIPGDLNPAVCIPIRTTRGQIVGAFLVGRKTGPAGNEMEFDPDELRQLKTLAEIAGNALLRARSHEELESAYIQTVLALANAVDARDTYTSDHSHRLAVLAEATAIEMDCSEEEIQAVHWAALLHDIGKIGVPDDVLSKPGPLTAPEWDIMRKHPEIGANIIAPLKRLTDVAPVIEAHQEKFDGTGYPLGLQGEEIPLPARILAVVDAYSAITDERVYRPARSHEEAMKELERCAGNQFDPRVVEAFSRVVTRDGSP